MTEKILFKQERKWNLVNFKIRKDSFNYKGETVKPKYWNIEATFFSKSGNRINRIYSIHQFIELCKIKKLYKFIEEAHQALIEDEI